MSLLRLSSVLKTAFNQSRQSEPEVWLHEILILTDPAHAPSWNIHNSDIHQVSRSMEADQNVHMNLDDMGFTLEDADMRSVCLVIWHISEQK